ncbi:MAG: hypothetical protein P4L64_00690 [Caulobacteraceae bacterium]|nr:hypothetical protein [Caulobacteraceae bacterium]
MPHTAASIIIIVKPVGGNTNGMAAAQAQSYLTNVLNDNNRIASLKQALNDVTGGKGKATGAYKFNGAAVWHASSGNGQQSVTLFYTVNGVTASIFAMGAHEGGSPAVQKYRITDFGPTTGDFAPNRVISI